MNDRLNGIARSLLVKRQRTLLDDIGARRGTPVVYLKAAWADPVLYGGRGERSGCDIDVLISAKAYDAFAAELLAAGFRKQPTLGLLTTKGETFRGPTGHLDVDLHRGLAQPPWFRTPDAAMLMRARPFDSPDGPIVGLSPTDQIVHLVAHSANSRFDLADRHLNDGLRVLDRFDIDWDAIMAACRDGFLEVALHIVTRLLVDHGARVPPIAESIQSRSRRLALAPFFDSTRGRRFPTSHPKTNSRFDLLVFLPLLSTRRSALPQLTAAILADRLGLDKRST